MSDQVLPADEAIRPPTGKARRYHVRLDDLVRIGEMPVGTVCVNVVPLDDHNHALNELFAEQRKVSAAKAENQALKVELESLRARVVVVPDRMQYDATLSGPAHRDNRRYVNGWNDALSHLNGNTVSEGLLRQIALALNCLTSWDFHGTIRHNFGENWSERVNGMRDELNALFGEGTP